MQTAKQVLWLAGWFPSVSNGASGNFIARHADAFAEFNAKMGHGYNLHVLHCALYPFFGKKAIPLNSSSLVYQLLWCPVPQFGSIGHAGDGQYGDQISPFARILNGIVKPIDHVIYTVYLRRFLQLYLRNHGNPVLVHVHAADKIGRIVPWLIKRLGVPLWLTEHWAIFNEIVEDGFSKRSISFQSMYKRLWKILTISAPVSHSSQKDLQHYLGNVLPSISSAQTASNCFVMPFVLFRNAVDTKVFYPISGISDVEEVSFNKTPIPNMEPNPKEDAPANPAESNAESKGVRNAESNAKKHPGIKAIKKTGPYRFIHVSSLDVRKNGEGILRAFAQFQIDNKNNATLTMVGANNQSMIQLSRSLNIQDKVFFTGNLPIQGVADAMRAADAFVLFSMMENAPCVISEALCCGLPVIATHVAGIPEMIFPERNGLLVAVADEDALSTTFSECMRIFPDSPYNEIAQDAQNIYGYDAVASTLTRSYQKILNTTCAE